MAARSYRANLHAADGPSEPPVTSEHKGRPYFGCRKPHRRRYARRLRFDDTVDASEASDCPDTSPTRHALASEPTSSTEWQLCTLNGLVGVVVVGANAWTYGLAGF